MAKKIRFKRPSDEEELAQREANGLWRAQALANEIADSGERITIDTILRVHREFFKEANPDHAGRFRHRGDDVKELQCVVPPPGSAVEEKMLEFWRELDTRLAQIPKHPKNPKGKHSRSEWMSKVIECAVWAHHRMTAIHPFCQGNGRMSRMLNNLILRRFGIPPSDIQHLGENKPHYLDALCQIDKFSDYDPLTKIVMEGVKSTYKKVYIIANKNVSSRSSKKRK